MAEDAETPREVASAAQRQACSPAERVQRLKELARLFLKLGTIAFGGPAAHIAMMDEEVVQRRGWLTRQQLLDLLGATNLIPGPNSTELAIHIGYERAGWRGLIVAGACFIVPAMCIVWLLAVLYVRYQSVPQLGWLLYGIKPVIIAIVVQALWRLGQSAVKNLRTGVAGGAVMVLAMVGGHELLLLLVAGLAVMLAENWRRLITRHGLGVLLLPAVSAALPASAMPLANVTASGTISLLNIFGFFLKVGSVLYGSGYVLLAFLQGDLVERWHWLTSDQLLDAIAIGQFTPGPVFTTATFIGYMLAGSPGAIVATVGIFLPAFVFVAAVNPWVPKLRRSQWASGFLDGVNAASMGLMAVVTWKLAAAALFDWLTVALALLSYGVVFRYRINSAWLVLAGGVVGMLAHL
jgi:chromate transporter